jgi:hypothetical protein
MDHLFVPLINDKGIQFNIPVEQHARVLIPGVSSKLCIRENYYCPDYLVGRQVETVFALFAHPTQLQEWRDLSRNFTTQNKEWNLFVRFSGIYCESTSAIVIKNGVVIRV